MASLASPNDVAVRLGRTLSTAETTRAQAMLDDASAIAKNYCRRSFTQTTETITIRPRGDTIHLPDGPVTDVSAVKVIYNRMDLPFTAYLWDGAYEVWLDVGGVQFINVSQAAIELFAHHTAMCKVTYTHGFAEVPDDVKAVVANMVVRAMVTPSQVLQSENVGPFSYTTSLTAQGGPLSIDAAGRQILNTYRRIGTTVELR